MGVRAAIAAGALLVGLAVPASASALTHYAAPAAQGTGDCSSPANACTLSTALLGSPNEVALAAGDYGSSGSPMPSFVLAPGELLHGPATGPLPRIFVGGSGVQLTGGAGVTARRVHIEATANYGAYIGEQGTLDQSFVHANSPSAVACSAYGGTITNSVCKTDSGVARGGLFLNANLAAATTITLRNDTLIGTNGSNGVYAVLSGAGTAGTLNFTNVIARGSGGATTDIFASATGGATESLNFDHSNYATKSDNGVSVTTAPGSGTNQTATPLLGTDGKELPGSPTIGAGVTDALNGPFDLDGDPRSINGHTDIGADELVSPLTYSLPATSLMLSRTGTGSLPFTCSASFGDVCTVRGTLTATVVLKPRRRHRSSAALTSKKQKKRKRVIVIPVGGVSGAVPSGQTGDLGVQLSSQARVALKSVRSLTALLDGTVKDTVGQSKPLSGTLSIQVQRPNKKRKRHKRR